MYSILLQKTGEVFKKNSILQCFRCCVQNETEKNVLFTCNQVTDNSLKMTFCIPALPDNAEDQAQRAYLEEGAVANGDIP